MTTTENDVLREPSGPRFGLVHLLRLRREPVKHSAWLREQYGEVYTMRVFGIEMYIVSGPTAFEQVFVNRDKVFASGPAWSHFIGPFFHRGLMLLDFEEHLHHRRIMQHAFGNDSLRRYHALLVPHLRRNLAAWEGTEKPLLQRMFKDLTLDLALEVFVGVELEPAERRRINKAFIAAVRAGTSIVRRELPGGIGPWSKGLEARRVLEKFFYDALPAKRRDGGDDLFGQLCVATDDDGNAFSDADIVNHMIFLLMAAHDTTTITMTSMAFQLAKHPEWQERCREEALAAPDPSYDDAMGLSLLDQVMKESMRLCAPVPSIPRTALRETSISGYRIPEGAILASSPYGNHFLEEVWPDPTAVRPRALLPRTTRGQGAPARLRGVRRRRPQVHRDALRGDAGAGDLPRAADDLPVVGARGLRDADRPGRPPGGPRRPAGDPGEAVSDTILDAAREVFEQYGARRANVDDVARAAGISRSTLYRAYPNKEALLAAVVARETGASFDELDRIAADLPPQEADHRVLRAWHLDDARHPRARPVRPDRARHGHRDVRRRVGDPGPCRAGGSDPAPLRCPDARPGAAPGR